MKWLFRLLRLSRDLKAIRTGRIGKRIYNRGVNKVVRKLYR